MICLIRPPAVECFRFSTGSITLPLGLAYVAAALEKAGREVCVVDAVALGPRTHTRYFKGYLVGLRLEDIGARIPGDASVVGVSVNFTHEWPVVARLVDLIKRARPELSVVLGGEHITAMPEFCLATSRADMLVLGEGEETIVKLIDALDAGRPLHEIDGLAYREEGRIIVNRRRKRRTEIDDIAWPAWQHIDVETYNIHHFVGGIDTAEVTIPILATRGCPYQCTFCASPNMWTTKWIPRDPVNVVDEIQYYRETYGAKNFPFQDLTAIIRKDWTVRFCEEILKRNLNIFWQFPSGTRSEAIDAEVADLLRRSGMINMGYAPESGSETTRKIIKKKMNTDRLLKSIEASVDAGLNVSLFFIIGFPHDTPELLKENFPFLDRIAAMGINDVAIGFYMALPGTELFNSLYDAGKVRLDRSYFAHILQGSALIPTETYNDRLGKVALTFWKLRHNLRFYAAKRVRRSGDGVIASIWRGIGGVFRSSHESRLETAIRNGVSSGFQTLKARFMRRWMPVDEETAMIEDWDAIYREIRRNNLAQEISVEAPSDTTRLHKSNVILGIRQEHGRARELAILG